MERLTKQDLHTLMVFLGDLYAPRDLPALRIHLISALPQLVPAELTTYLEMNPAKAVSQNWAEPAELGTAPWARLWERHMNDTRSSSTACRPATCGRTRSRTSSRRASSAA